MKGSSASDCARVFLERLKQELELRGGVWLRLADYPFPFQSAMALGVEHAAEEMTDFQALAGTLPGQVTHFVSSRLRGEALSPLVEGPRVDLGWHILPDDFEISRRSTLSHWSTRIARFRAAGLAISGLALSETDEPLPSTAALLKLGLRYACQHHRGLTCQVEHPERTAKRPAWIKLGTLPLPHRDEFVEWVGEHYQSGCPLLLTASTARFNIIHDLLSLARDAARCSLLWQTSLGEFARWWQMRRNLRIQVWRRNAGCEIHADGEFGLFPWGIEIWRGNHLATVPLKTPELHVPDDGLVYLRAQKKNPGGCTVPNDSVWELLTARTKETAAA
ncbi:MAG: hypothetical protein EXS05_20340 [Planctomycetaceae bacterium]|nr:hypothetical protein [Planctomycetaceae bacterium]